MVLDFVRVAFSRTRWLGLRGRVELSQFYYIQLLEGNTISLGRSASGVYRSVCLESRVENSTLAALCVYQDVSRSVLDVGILSGQSGRILVWMSAWQVQTL